MDYTKLPRELIYKEKTDLDEFTEGEEANFFIIDNMLNSYFFKGVDGKEEVLICLNTAYYICTLILLCDKRPEWNYEIYCEIAKCNRREGYYKKYQCFTLLLVYLYLSHIYYDAQCPILLDKIKDFIDENHTGVVLNGTFYSCKNAMYDLQKGLPEYFLIAEEFNPRKISRDIFREIESHRGCIWNKLTDNYGEEETQKLIEAIGKDEEEKHIIIELINSEAERFYGTDNFYYKENVKPMLDEMDRQIGSENIEASKNDADTKETQDNGAEVSEQSQISELEIKYKALQEKYDRFKKIYSSSNYDIDEIENIKNELEKQKTNYKTLQSEFDNLKEIHQNTLVELLRPCFYIKEDIILFLNDIKNKNKDNVAIAAVAKEYINNGKIIESKSKRDIWKVIHAANLYDGVEQNWSGAIRKGKKKK